MLPKSLFKKGLFLAPMANYSDLGMRRISFDYGAGYTFTEMVSAHEIMKSADIRFRELDSFDPEVPTGIQIITPSPEMLGKAISRIKEQNAPPLSNISSICLNLGCPRIKNSGSFLLEKTDVIEELFKAMKSSSDIPVCAKIRLAGNSEHLAEKPYLKIARLAGKYLDFLIVHGRTRAQMYSGTVDLSSIKEIRDSVSIPVVGNGDIMKPSDAKKMFDETGCDAVMVGRAAIRRPFIFREIRDYLKNGKEPDIDEKGERLECAVKYLKIGEKMNCSVFQTRIHLQGFLKGTFRLLNERITKEKTVQGMKELVMAEYESYF
jgi:tRNA-dihydrouridine synthase B